MLLFFGFLGGFGLPIQTSINAQLRNKVKSPYNASLISFFVSLSFIIFLLIITKQELYIPLDKLCNEPFWIWIGGICGVIFLTGNILLASKLGSVQTVIFPVLGQIIMGLTIDNFALFNARKSEVSITKLLGVSLVILGVIIVSVAKEKRYKNKGNISEKNDIKIWYWRLLGICTGMVSATQVAANGYLGTVLGSPIKASLVSFIVGVSLLIIIYLFRKKDESLLFLLCNDKYPFWIWFGGILGGIFVLANATLSSVIGIGTTVIVMLFGSTTGSLVVDHFGLFNSKRKPVNVYTILGILIMLIGTALVKLV